MRTPLERSPHDLMQERLRRRPWALLVGCILYNKVRGATAWPLLAALLRKWPTHEAMHNDLGEVGGHVSVREDLEDLLRPLGLQRRRAKLVVDLTKAWFDSSNADIEDLPGCGRYAAESFEIFVRGRLVPRPQDKELRRYVNWARAKARRGHS